MPIQVQCETCGKIEHVQPARVKRGYRFCSYACRGVWQRTAYAGTNNHRWQEDRVREKTCPGCGEVFSANGAIGGFDKRIFCSKPCADKHGFRYSGDEHPNWKEDSLPKKRDYRHDAWAKAVKEKDDYTCQGCDRRGGDLHSHHILQYSEHPEYRYDLRNGTTLCIPCHHEIHSLAASIKTA